jgi:hypothetical protein
MKRLLSKVKNNSTAEKVAAIPNFRGKYKHLDLMKELTKSRRQDRQPDRQSASVATGV